MISVSVVEWVIFADYSGSESLTPWSRDEIILMILDQRMEQQKLTCFTSNYSCQELHDKYTYENGRYPEKVAASRILERIQVLTCEIFKKESIGNYRKMLKILEEVNEWNIDWTLKESEKWEMSMSVVVID